MVATSREKWLRDFAIIRAANLSGLNNVEDWDAFKNLAKEYAQDLLYAVTEWEKYYGNK